MPCGGIWPVDEKSGAYAPGKNPRCWMARNPDHNKEPGPWSWVEEWDTLIHDKCIDEFLKTREGKIITDHGHEITRRGE